MLAIICTIACAQFNSAKAAPGANAGMERPKELAAAFARMYNAEFDTVEKQCKKGISESKEQEGKARWTALAALNEVYRSGQPRPTYINQFLKSPSSESDSLATAAVACELSGNTGAARKLAEQSLSADARNARGHAALAHCLQKEGKAGASGELKAALKLDGKDFDVNLLAADMTARTVDAQAAMKYYDDLVKNHPQSAMAYFRRGMFLRDFFEKKGAMADLAKTCELNPNFNGALAINAKLLANMGHYKEAIPMFDRSIKSGNISYSRRAECYMALKQYDKAVLDFTSAMEKDTRHSPSGTVRTHNLPIQLQFSDDYRKCWMLRAECYQKSGKYDKALEDLTKYLNQYPRDLNAIFMRQQVFQQKGLFEKALQDLTVLIQANPDVAQWYLSRAQVYKKMGKSNEAERDLLTAKRIETTGSPN